jgi:hypothetical protein
MDAKKILSFKHPFGVSLYILGVFVLSYWITFQVSHKVPSAYASQWPFAIHATFLLVLSFLHALLILGTAMNTKNFSTMLYGLLLYLISGLLVIRLFSGLRIQDGESFMMVYPLLLGCYLLMVVIALLIKKLIEFAHEKP